MGACLSVNSDFHTARLAEQPLMGPVRTFTRSACGAAIYTIAISPCRRSAVLSNCVPFDIPSSLCPSGAPCPKMANKASGKLEAVQTLQGECGDLTYPGIFRVPRHLLTPALPSHYLVMSVGREHLMILEAPLAQNNLVELVEVRLYNAIVSGGLRPGERIVEAALARKLNISRAPIREAARRLEDRGLLIWIPRRGFFVKTLTEKDVEDLYGVRIALELYAMEIAVGRVTAKDIAELVNILAAAEHIAPGGEDDIKFVEVDLSFHRAICALAGNERLLQAFDGLIAELRLALALVNRGYGSGPKYVARHSTIIEAIRSNDANAAKTSLREHLVHSCTMVTGYIRRGNS